MSINNQNILEAMIAQSKLSKKKTDKQQRVLEAAIELFAEKGFANTSTSEIAKRAEVAEGTIFRHYGNKDNLLLSVILPFLKDSLPSMAEGVFQEVFPNSESSFEDFLRALIKNRLHFIKENKEVFQIIVKEFLYNEELRKDLLPYFTDNITRRLLGAIEIFKQRGELIDLPSNTLLKLMFNTVGGYFVSQLLLSPNDKTQDEETDIDHIVRYIMDGIRNRT